MARQKKNVLYTRNPVYVFYALAGITLFLYSAFVASRTNIGPLENIVFDLFYKLPEFLRPFFKFITLFGSIGSAIVLSIIFLFRRRDISLRLIVASGSAYLFAFLLKDWVVRARPQFLLDYVVPRDQAAASGFPSGHAAVATAIGLTLALYAPRTYRKWIILGILLVCCSRLYLGVHLPMDVIGGYAIGLFCYSITCLLLGSKFTPINTKALMKRLTQKGMTGLTLKPAAVDARGSVPFFGTFAGGNVFIKVYNQDNNAADWLFKLVRRMRFRRLEDEVPYFTPKRALEHEALLTMSAKYLAGIRAPEIVGVYNVAPNSYAMATLRLEATGLNKMTEIEVTDKMLDDTWSQILTLHKNNMVHRDLRCANVMIEKKTSLPWIIDFGFAENAVENHIHYKDNVEFIASSATIVGAKRAVEAAKRAIGSEGLEQAIPYMQYAALSGATTTSLKEKKGLLEDVRAQMLNAASVDVEKVKDAKINRIGKNNIFQLAVVLVLLAILIPQLSSLKGSISVLKTTDLLIYSLALLLSVITYALAALCYKTLSDIPLRFKRLFVVQWAGSFANRILPAGIGSLSFNTLFMVKSGHNEGESGTIAVVNNLLGIVSSALLIIVALFQWKNTYDPFKNSNFSIKNILIVVAVVMVVVIVLVVLFKHFKGLQEKIRKWKQESKESLKNYASRPMTLIGALLVQILITLTYTTIMVVCAKALDTGLNFSQALFAVSLGTLIGNIIPTPGGIGGAEAGIVAALSVVGVPIETAIAIALLYRFATFWLTIPPGYIAYRYAFAHNYFN